MKRNIFILAIFAALFSFSCQKESMDVVDKDATIGKKTVTAYAEIMETKVKFDLDNNRLTWSTGDSFGIYSDNGDDNVQSSKFSYNEEGGKKFTFTVNEGTTSFTAYFPFDKNGSKDQTAKRANQNWYWKDYPSYYPLKAEGMVGDDNTVHLSFVPQVCALQLRFFGGKAGESLESVSLKYDEYSIILRPGSNKLLVDMSKSKENADFVYLSVEKGTIPAGAVFGISTNEGLYTFETKKELDVNCDVRPVSFDLSGRTPEVDYYEQGIEIDGVSYDKNSSNAIELRDSGGNIYTSAHNGKVCFISDDITVNLSGSYSNLVIIGRSSIKKPTVKLGSNISIKGSGSIIFKNVIIDGLSATSNYLINRSNDEAVVDNFIFEDCDIKLKDGGSLMYFNTTLNTDINIKRAVFRRNTVSFGNSGNLFNFNAKNIAPEAVIIEDNLIYDRSGNGVVNGSLLSLNGNVLQDNLKLLFKNNTLVNYGGKSKDLTPIFNLSKGKEMNLSFEKNLIINTLDNWKFRWVGFSSMSSTNVAEYTGNISFDNKHYGNDCSFEFAYIQGLTGFTNLTGAPAFKITDLESSNPLTTCDCANGIFELDSAYEGYGSSLVPLASAK